jgi:hypothetical protein
LTLFAARGTLFAKVVVRGENQQNRKALALLENAYSVEVVSKMTQFKAFQCVYADIPGVKTRLIVEELHHRWIFGAVDKGTKQLVDKASVPSLQDGKEQAKHWAIGSGYMTPQDVLMWQPWP